VSTTTVKENILRNLGEGSLTSDATALTNALRWANRGLSTINLRYRFKHLLTKSIFRTAVGQATYQAPSDFSGFLIMKDESNDRPLDQVTPEELQRTSGSNGVTNESFTADLDVAVQLDHTAIVQFSETVTNTAGTVTYTKDSDYTMDYEDGYITALSTGLMADSTSYYIDYLYKTDDKPSKFALEYDGTNKRYVFRMEPVPDAAYVFSILYPAFPSALSGSVDPIWDKLEVCLESWGTWFGALELIDDVQKRQEFRGIAEADLQALIQLDMELVPKNARIKVVMRKSDYN
jgi:hypothetical protein